MFKENPQDDGEERSKDDHCAQTPRILVQIGPRD